MLSWVKITVPLIAIMFTGLGAYHEMVVQAKFDSLEEHKAETLQVEMYNELIKKDYENVKEAVEKINKKQEVQSQDIKQMIRLMGAVPVSDTLGDTL